VEAPVPYGDDFGFKNEEIGPENTCFLNSNLDGLIAIQIENSICLILAK